LHQSPHEQPVAKLHGVEMFSQTTQWSFRKTGTMGTLASQAEIGVWVQAPGRFCGALGLLPLEKKF